MNQNIVDNNQKKYNKLLQELIPNLDKYSYLSGTEGNVYFVHDDYVVKEYYNSLFSIEFFNEYCKEIQSFEEQGLSVPKIYAWDNITTKSGRRIFYILEERVKGKTLFNEMSEIYPKVQHLCSTDEFNNTIFNCNQNPKLFAEIVIAYLSDINDTAKNLLNMEENKLTAFINTLYHLYTDSKNSYPDIHENNIIFDGKSLTIIDQTPLKRSPLEKKSTTLNQISHHVLYDIFEIFEKFSAIQYTKILDITLKPKFEKVKQETLNNAKSVITKFCKHYQKYLPENIFTFDDYYGGISYIFDNKLAKKLAEELEKE